MEIFARNNNDLFKNAVLSIREFGVESESGNSQVNQDGTRFIDGVFVATVIDPTDRWLNVEGRKSSAIAAIGETLWVLAGRNDMDYLSRFLPRATNFSDDGVTWRAAYGPRLYNHYQLDSIINRLKKNHNTRQAYLTIYDPVLDSDLGLKVNDPGGLPQTKDMVCNFALLFSIREGKLNLTVTNRSQDVLWGMSSINFIEFSILQEIIARIVGVQVGAYSLVSNNVHYYNNKVSQDQLGKVKQETLVNVSNSSPIKFWKGIDNQTYLREFFLRLTQHLEHTTKFEVILNYLSEHGAETGLLRDMAYVAWCKLSSNLIEVDNISDEGLRESICSSPVDRKYIKAHTNGTNIL